MIKKLKDMEDLKKAFKDAGDKAIIVEFYASWCPPCKAIGPKFSSLSKKYPSVKAYKVDVDDAEDIVSKYRVSSMPTFKVFADGHPKRGGSKIAPTVEELEDLFMKFS